MKASKIIEKGRVVAVGSGLGLFLQIILGLELLHRASERHEGLLHFFSLQRGKLFGSPLRHKYFWWRKSKDIAPHQLGECVRIQCDLLQISENAVRPKCFGARPDLRFPKKAFALSLEPAQMAQRFLRSGMDYAKHCLLPNVKGEPCGG